MRLLILVCLIACGSVAQAQTLDTAEALLNHGRIVDAKQYLDAIEDTAVQGTIKYQLVKAHLYKELFKQSLQLFGIKNNNWLATSCNAYVDGVTALAQRTRVPDSLFVLIADCYKNAANQAAEEQASGSLGLAEDLFYTAHHSATLWSLVSGTAITDTTVQYQLGMYFYARGQQSLAEESRQEHYARARHYLLPLAGYKREEVLEAIREMK